jgi:hypothetical protein
MNHDMRNRAKMGKQEHEGVLWQRGSSRTRNRRTNGKPVQAVHLQGHGDRGGGVSNRRFTFAAQGFASSTPHPPRDHTLVSVRPYSMSFAVPHGRPFTLAEPASGIGAAIINLRGITAAHVAGLHRLNKGQYGDLSNLYDTFVFNRTKLESRWL